MAPADEGSIAFLQYTSGSTEAPKGVMVSHGNIVANQKVIVSVMAQTEQRGIAGWLPLFHDMGLLGLVMQGLFGRLPAYLMTPTQFLFSPRRWLEMIGRYGATAGAIPNSMLDFCVKRIPREDRAMLDLSSLRVLFVGAEPVIAHSIERFHEAFVPAGLRADVLTPTFGLAESTLMVSARRAAGPCVIRRYLRCELARGRAVRGEDAPDKDSSALVGCGAALDGHEIRIVDPKTRRPCADGQIGEIWTSGPSVAKGYWGREALSEAIFQARLSTGEQGHLRTGDLGFLDVGELFVTGRIKDLIILDGCKLHSEDLEVTARRSSPLLQDSSGAAFAIPFLDGEGVALVYEVDTRKRADWQQVISEIRLRVGEVHDTALDAVALIPLRALPRTSSGKLQRHACRETFLAGRFIVVAEWRSNRWGVRQ
jgi:acyl-CoA synthetase (AMP-forming)/AMP-acid ligase II